MKIEKIYIYSIYCIIELNIYNIQVFLYVSTDLFQDFEANLLLKMKKKWSEYLINVLIMSSLGHYELFCYCPSAENDALQ